MKTIPLTQGKTALVDDEWYDVLVQYKWFAFQHHGTWYAARNTWHPDPSHKKGGRIEMIRMHRHVMGCTKNDGKIVDHHDHDGLNNQRSNLRFADKFQSARNQRPKNGRKYKGVHPNTRGFQARINIAGKETALGTFPTEREAAAVYNEAAKKYFGQFAWLNPSVSGS